MAAHARLKGTPPELLPDPQRPQNGGAASG
jgi:hypothetical protein